MVRLGLCLLVLMTTAAKADPWDPVVVEKMSVSIYDQSHRVQYEAEDEYRRNPGRPGYERSLRERVVRNAQTLNMVAYRFASRVKKFPQGPEFSKADYEDVVDYFYDVSDDVTWANFSLLLRSDVEKLGRDIKNLKRFY